MLSLEAISTIETIERKGSFAAAAKELGRVPSALTYTVQKIESDLDIKIFDRNHKTPILTPAGKALVNHGRSLLKSAYGLESLVKRVHSGWEPELRIACDTIFRVEKMYPLIQNFNLETKETRIKLSHEVLGGGWDALANDRCDLAIGVSGDSPSGGGYSTIEIGEIEFVFAVSPNHPLANEEQISIQKIKEHTMIVVADSSRVLQPKTVGVLDGQHQLTVPDMIAKICAQVLGMGCGNVPLHLIQNELNQKQLVIKKNEDKSPQVKFFIAWKTQNKGKALHWFLHKLNEASLLKSLFST